MYNDLTNALVAHLASIMPNYRVDRWSANSNYNRPVGTGLILVAHQGIKSTAPQGQQGNRAMLQSETAVYGLMLQLVDLRKDGDTSDLEIVRGNLTGWQPDPKLSDPYVTLSETGFYLTQQAQATTETGLWYFEQQWAIDSTYLKFRR